MKKFLSVVLVCAMLFGCVLSLASCGNKPSGKYQAKVELFGQSVTTTYNFKLSKVIVTIETEILGSVETEENEYKYKVNKKDDGTLTIDLTGEVDGEEKTQTYTYEKGDDYIKIGGVQYNKVK